MFVSTRRLGVVYATGAVCRRAHVYAQAGDSSEGILFVTKAN
jgi:hypothetical protein